MRVAGRTNGIVSPALPHTTRKITASPGRKSSNLAALLRSSPKAGYAQLFAQSAGTLQDVAATRLGIEPGFLGILQTWTRDLRFHPHVHYLVPGGGLTRPGRWRSVPDAGFFLPQRVLAARFRTRFKRWLQQT